MIRWPRQKHKAKEGAVEGDFISLPWTHLDCLVDFTRRGLPSAEADARDLEPAAERCVGLLIDEAVRGGDPLLLLVEAPLVCFFLEGAYHLPFL